MCPCEKSALMEQAIHTNTIAHFLMHHMEQFKTFDNPYTVWLLVNLFVALYALLATSALATRVGTRVPQPQMCP